MRKNLLTGFLFCWCASLCAQTEQFFSNGYYIEKFTAEDGLPGTSVPSIVQDTSGYLWLATHDGLAKYDGYQFEVFKSDTSSDKSAYANFFYTLQLDQKQRLWAGTLRDGLYLFDLQQEQFVQHFMADEADSNSVRSSWIVDLAEDTAGFIWVKTDGLQRIKENGDAFIFEQQTAFNQVDDLQFVLSIAQPLSGVFSEKKITNFELKNGSITTEEWTSPLVSQELVAHSGKAGWYWLIGQSTGSTTKQLYKWQPSTDQLVSYQLGLPQDIPIQHLFEDAFGNLWLGTWGRGIYLIEATEGKYAQAKHIPLDPQNLQAKGNIWDFFPDCFGNLWVGTWRGHLFKIRLHRQAQFFTLPQSTSGRIAPGKLAEGSDGKIWMTATDGQLYRFDPATNDFRRFALPNPAEARTIDVTMPIAFDAKGVIWIGSFHGLLSFDPATDQTQFYPIRRRDQSLRDDWINVLHRSENTLWCGTSHGSIYSFDLQQKKFQTWHEEYTNLGVINDLHWHTDGVLFASTSRGIHKINTTDTTRSSFFERYRGSLDLQPGQGTTLWVTSYLNGLKQIDFNGELLNNYQQAGDFSVNWNTAIAEDANGHFWLSGPEGMLRFNPTSEHFAAFLTLNQFSFPKSATKLGHCVSKTGTIYWAGDAGLIAFHPQQIVADTIPPHSIIQQVMVNDSILHAVLPNQPLRLPYSKNDVTITYAGLHFGNPEWTTYQYQLEGVQSHWVDVGKERTARFSNLAPGQYTFRLKAANGDGVWEQQETTLVIHVLPPWWRTWWAYLLFTAIVLGGILWLYRFQLHRQLAIEEANRLKELDQLKTRMYTNITHEFRTPLTVIQGMSEQARLFFQRSSASDFDTAIRAIQRNARQLLKLINQMLDLSKLEAGRLSVQMIQDDAVAYLHYLAESFQSHAESKSVKLQIIKNTDSLMMDFDPDKLMHITSNLLSNAIKFTPEGGQVTFEIDAVDINDQPSLKFVVKDSGIGIAKKDLPYIFDRFFQVDDSSTRDGEGTGIGLSLTKELVDLLEGEIRVDSLEGVGTVFTVQLPVRKNAERAAAKSSMEVPVLTDETIVNAENGSSDLPSILIVEDNVDVRHYIQLSLAGKYQTILARDGEEGIQMALEHIPDLIISDVMMPKKDGFELCRTLKQSETTSHIPIVLLTARANEDSRIEGLEGGADAYLSKPFNQRELFVRLKKLIELRQRLQDYYRNASPVEARTSSAFPKEDVFIQKIQALLEERLEDEDFNVQHLTRDLGMSRSQVFKKLKALTGKSIVQYMREYRLQRARQLLQNSELSISEVAYQVGFRDPAYFSRAFSKAFGIAPSEIRK